MVYIIEHFWYYDLENIVYSFDLITSCLINEIDENWIREVEYYMLKIFSKNVLKSNLGALELECFMLSNVVTYK